MPWVPIAESGITYSFSPDDPGNTMEGSVVTSVGAADTYTGWRLYIQGGAERQIRATIQSWSFPDAGVNEHYFRWDAAPDSSPFTQFNEAADPSVAFSPNPVEATVFELEGSDARFSFYVDFFAPGLNIEILIEAFIDAPECFWTDLTNASQTCN